MDKIQFLSVGKIINQFNESSDPLLIKKELSKLIINPAYEDALLNIKECEYLEVIYYFHQLNNNSYPFSQKTRSGKTRGVFASRSPMRPNLIGITTVKLHTVKNNELIVSGLDALNDSPILDIKCCDTSLFAYEKDNNSIHNSILKSDPRIEIQNHIFNERTDLLLLKAGQIHGHFCPGLSMGVMAASYAMSRLKASSDGMEDLLAITETNNCFSDGVQLVTGCSFGNNALIYKDLGKTAFTLTRRDGKGIRICSRHESREIITKAFPDFQNYYQKVVVEQNHDPELTSTYRKLALERAFGTLAIPFDQLFTTQEITVSIPEYASIRKSVVCAACEESVMENRTVLIEGKPYCYSCADKGYSVLNGDGIHIG